MAKKKEAYGFVLGSAKLPKGSEVGRLLYRLAEYMRAKEIGVRTDGEDGCILVAERTYSQNCEIWLPVAPPPLTFDKYSGTVLGPTPEGLAKAAQYVKGWDRLKSERKAAHGQMVNLLLGGDTKSRVSNLFYFDPRPYGAHRTLFRCANDDDVNIPTWSVSYPPHREHWNEILKDAGY